MGRFVKREKAVGSVQDFWRVVAKRLQKPGFWLHRSRTLREDACSLDGTGFCLKKPGFLLGTIVGDRRGQRILGTDGSGCGARGEAQSVPIRSRNPLTVTHLKVREGRVVMPLRALSVF